MNVFYNLYSDNKNSFYYCYKNNKNLNAIIKAINEQLITDKGSCQLIKSEFIASNNKNCERIANLFAILFWRTIFINNSNKKIIKEF